MLFILFVDGHLDVHAAEAFTSFPVMFAGAFGIGRFLHLAGAMPVVALLSLLQVFDILLVGVRLAPEGDTEGQRLSRYICLFCYHSVFSIIKDGGLRRHSSLASLRLLQYELLRI